MGHPSVISRITGGAGADTIDVSIGYGFNPHLGAGLNVVDGGDGDDTITAQVDTDESDESGGRTTRKTGSTAAPATMSSRCSPK